MRKANFTVWLSVAVASILAGCAHPKPDGSRATEAKPELAEPAADLGDRTWGIACLSVASAREAPEHKAEMGTQVLMGNVVRVLKGSRIWYFVETADGYHAWVEKGTIFRCTSEQADAWQRSPLLIVTALEDSITDRPQMGAQPVSDVVLGDLLKLKSEAGDWVNVELPDGRAGFLPKKSAEDYAAWRQSRKPTAENIELIGRRLLGRPYLWGANSPKGMDCSGFTKLVFFMNGIELKRNARDQARQGVEVPLDGNLSQLQKGDLLCFGARPRGDRPEKVMHVGIYLGDKLFMQSSERVQINSLDPDSPQRDEHRIRSLIHARRVLP